MTPGAYLRARRNAVGLSLTDVAQLLATQPRMAEHLRVEWLSLIEADAHPATFGTIAALRCAFYFDIEALARLSLIQLGAPMAPPLLCEICGAGVDQPCPTGLTCRWQPTIVVDITPTPRGEAW